MQPIEKLAKLDLDIRNFGFNWPNYHMVLEQIINECQEVKEVIEQNQGLNRLQEEIGDVIHAAISLCSYAKFNSNETILKTCEKFQQRCNALKIIALEHGLSDFNGLEINKQLELWNLAKQHVINSNIPKIDIKFMQLHDADVICNAFKNIGWDSQLSQYNQYFKEQQLEKRQVFVAQVNEEFAGYVTLVKISKYLNFANNNIPEISDLNVLPRFRNLGVASKLLSMAEAEAKNLNDIVGIGVGLTADYANAHRLYINLGYLPDNYGITYNYQSLEFNDDVKVNDDLILWMIKHLA
jgi:uncharacterized protein YabN with tetrapyrrole methylase and pyrophosphatase domain